MRQKKRPLVLTIQVAMLTLPRGIALRGRLDMWELSLPRHAGQCLCTRRGMCVVAERISTRNSCRQPVPLGVKPFDQVPRVTTFSLLGRLSEYLGVAGNHSIQEAYESGLKLYHSHGSIAVQKLLGRYSLVHLFGAKDFQTVFQEEGPTPFRIGMAAIKYYRDRTSQKYTDASLMHIQGELWKRIRSAGKSHILRNSAAMSYIPAIDAAAEDAVNLIGKSTDDNGEVEDCFHLMRRWVLESTTLVSIGVRLGSLEAHHLPQWADSEAILEDTMVAMDSLQKFCNRFPYYRYFPTPMWRRFVRAMDDHTDRVTRHVKDAASNFLNAEQREPRTILERLLVDSKLDFAEIVTLIRDLILGGIETTASAATACLLDFARHPEVQERARNEVVAVVGEDVTAIQPEHLERLPYLNACMKETMRLNPPVLGISRKLQRDIVLSGYLIPAKTTVFLHILEASRLPENFSEPGAFRPERWITSEKKCEGWIHNAFASLSFGSGKRSCIGRRIAELELCALLAKVLQKYEVEHQYQDVEFHETFFSIPKEPVRLRLKKRRTLI